MQVDQMYNKMVWNEIYLCTVLERNLHMHGVHVQSKVVYAYVRDVRLTCRLAVRDHLSKQT
jgi:hypothetical protein